MDKILNSIVTNLVFLVLIFFAVKFLINEKAVAFIAGLLKQNTVGKLPYYLLYTLGVFVIFIFVNLAALVHNGNERFAYFLMAFLYLSSVFILNHFFSRIFFVITNAAQVSIIVTAITAGIGWLSVAHLTRIGFVNNL